MTRRRCAIYTRKSTEEGLDQAFNSLDAQREACEAFIASQRHEGWQLVRKAYDDGGYSGGSMERPALQNLMRDVSEGLVDGRNESAIRRQAHRRLDLDARQAWRLGPREDLRELLFESLLNLAARRSCVASGEAALLEERRERRHENIRR